MRLQSSFWLGLCSHLGYRLGGDSASSSLVWLLASCHLSPHGSLHRVASQHDRLASNIKSKQMRAPQNNFCYSLFIRSELLSWTLPQVEENYLRASISGDVVYWTILGAYHRRCFLVFLRPCSVSRAQWYLCLDYWGITTAGIRCKSMQRDVASYHSRQSSQLLFVSDDRSVSVKHSIRISKLDHSYHNCLWQRQRHNNVYLFIALNGVLNSMCPYVL